MKARYKIHPDKGYVESWVEGDVTPSDYWEHAQQVWSDPAWNAGMSGLIDFTKAKFLYSDAELRELIKAMLADTRCSLARWALVVTTADSFAFLRKVDQLTDQQSTLRIFFSRSDAESWLLGPRKVAGEGSGS
jgi:hypothetical protein